MKNYGNGVEIDADCIETYPCIHKVRVDGVDKKMSQRHIAKLLRERGIKVPKHFEVVDEKYFYSEAFDRDRAALQ